MDDNLAQRSERRLQPTPNPDRKLLAGRIFQTRNIIEAAMIDCVEHRREGCLDIGEIHHPAGVRLRLAGNVDFHAKRMPVQPRAFMARGNVRETVRRLDLEYFENVHIFKDYGADVTPWWLWVDSNHRPQHYECCALTG